tara:strand:+ start:21636 stop:23096 length:1461 start_codon:yes stop_codon:yes gene_type:complete
MKDFLFYRAMASPDQISILDTATNESWSYSYLNEKVTQLSIFLSQKGIEPLDKVGLFLDTSIKSVIALHATLRIGACCVPLSIKSPPEELSNHIQVSCPDWILSQKEICIDLDSFEIPIISLDDFHSPCPSISFNSPIFHYPESNLDDTCLLLFTSGTTGGFPKAVPITYQNLLSSSISSSLRLKTKKNDIWLLYLPLNHMGGISPVLRSVLAGTTLATMDSPTIENLKFCMENYDITCLSIVPTLLEKFIQEQVDLSTLRFLLLGGGPISIDLLSRCNSLSIPVHPTYGTTETSSQIATALPSDLDRHSGTVGRPLDLLNIVIKNEQNQSVNEGEIGEIIVSGPMVSNGYLSPEYSDSSRLSNHTFRTGDLGYLKNGFLWICGRMDDLIIIGGENVYPIEIETIISTHKNVNDVAVFREKDEKWGSKIVAVVVRNNSILSEQELISFCEKKLSKYKIPKTIHFVDSIPRTVTGTFNSHTFTSNNK